MSSEQTLIAVVINLLFLGTIQFFAPAFWSGAVLLYMGTMLGIMYSFMPFATFLSSETREMRHGLLPFALACYTLFILNVSGILPIHNEKPVTAGSAYTIDITPEYMQQKPLYNVNFIDAQASEDSRVVSMGKDGSAVIGIADAILASYTLDRLVDGKHVEITPLEPLADRARELFLVSFDDAAPTGYELMANEPTQDGQMLELRSKGHRATITKKFLFNPRTYAVTMLLAIDPRGGTVRPRIMLPAPHITSLTAEANRYQGVLFNDRSSVEKVSVADIAARIWAAPTLFGVEDRYAVHALVNDTDHFVRRAYYVPMAQGSMAAILEGPEISEPTNWSLTFYVGPKELQALDAVDNRLVGMLDYGWLAWLSRLLLALLNGIYASLQNYGWAIVVVAALVRLALFPISIGSQRSSQKRTELMRRLSSVEKRYKNDPDRLMQEKMELHRQFGSEFSLLKDVLPGVAQVLLFVAFNRVLSSSVELYKASFYWVPDLSMPDPFYVFPVVTGLFMAIQLLTQKGMGAGQRFAFAMLSLLIVGFMAKLSAGLSLYFAASATASYLLTQVQKFFKL